MDTASTPGHRWTHDALRAGTSPQNTDTETPQDSAILSTFRVVGVVRPLSHCETASPVTSHLRASSALVSRAFSRQRVMRSLISTKPH